MTFEWRLAVVALAAFGAMSAAAACVVPLQTRRWARRASVTAAVLFQLRLLPAAAAVVAMVLAIASFALFEPRDGQERTGLVLLLCAAGAAAMLATTALRFVRTQIAGRRAVEQWMSAAEPIALPGLDIPAYAITSTFPIVAVVGIFRPRLIVARSVLANCSTDQLDAILAHERWHLRNHDNARRAILFAVPDVWMWGSLSRRVYAMWQIAAEEAADAEAARSGTARRLHLAEALIRVARLAPADTTSIGLDLPASALYRGEGIERRVRRLLDPAVNLAEPRPASRWLRLAAGGVLIASVLTLNTIHAIVEAAVAYLP